MAEDTNNSLIYVGASGGTLKRQFDTNSATWINVYTLSSVGTRYLSADFTGVNPVIYATTTEAPFNRLVSIVDTDASAPAVTLATAGVNQTFRGIRFGPAEVVAPPTLSVSANGSDVILNWAGSHTLQSATNVAGPYLDVAGPVLTGPYTNSTLAPAQMYFRLRN